MGSRLRVRGEGNAGRRGGETGDLYVFVSVKDHPAGLKRDGTTIHSEIDIPYVDAILGTTAKACLSPIAFITFVIRGRKYCSGKPCTGQQMSAGPRSMPPSG